MTSNCNISILPYELFELVFNYLSLKDIFPFIISSKKYINIKFYVINNLYYYDFYQWTNKIKTIIVYNNPIEEYNGLIKFIYSNYLKCCNIKESPIIYAELNFEKYILNKSLYENIEYNQILDYNINLVLQLFNKLKITKYIDKIFLRHLPYLKNIDEVIFSRCGYSPVLNNIVNDYSTSIQFKIKKITFESSSFLGKWVKIFLGKCINLEYLDISYNYIPVNHLEMVLNVIKNYKKLKYLNLSNIRLENKFPILLNSIIYHNKFDYLNLSNNQITNFNFIKNYNMKIDIDTFVFDNNISNNYIFEFLDTNIKNNIRSLSLINNNISINYYKLFDKLTTIENLEKLYLDKNNLIDENIKHLLQNIDKLKKIKIISIKLNKLNKCMYFIEEIDKIYTDKNIKILYNFDFNIDIY